MKFFIIHGTYSNPSSNWFPWLKKELELLGHEVFVPKFPTPENQTLENWMKVFDGYIDKVDSNTIFVAHSIGPAFVLSVLEKINIQVRACFFVAAGLSESGTSDIYKLIHTFLMKDFDWHRIKENCENFYMFHSDNDPYVPIEKAEDFARKLNITLTKVPGAGHFNEAAGYTKFDLLLEKIKEAI